MNRTPIEWTTFSANPLKYRDASGKVVWACVHASKGCEHCYAETLAKRYGKGGPFNVPTTAKVTPFLDEKELRQMLTAKRIGGQDVAGSRCFVGDMTDIFGPWVPDALLDRLFATFALRSDVVWQVLTKRADRMRAYVTTAGESDDVTVQAHDLAGEEFDFFRAKRVEWPLPNVWLGVSCEDQQRADERIPLLLQTPAAVRFISAEPLLGPIDLRRHFYGPSDWNPNLQLHFVIAGSESGHGARPWDLGWFQSLRDQCVDARAAFFLKQFATPAGRKIGLPELDGRTWAEFPRSVVPA